MFRTVGVVNHDGNKAATAEGDDLTIVVAARAEAVEALWRGSLGRTVRCVPTRQTLMAEDQFGTLFAKRYRSARRARNEWRWLGELQRAGLPGPPPPGQPRLGAGPAGVDPAALQALLNSVQSNPALMANLGAARSSGGGASSTYGICAFFNTPQGCHRGNQCKFKHVRDAPAGPQAFPFIKRHG